MLCNLIFKEYEELFITGVTADSQICGTQRRKIFNIFTRYAMILGLDLICATQQHRYPQLITMLTISSPELPGAIKPVRINDTWTRFLHTDS